MSAVNFALPVSAIQWDGTASGARKIATWLVAREHAPDARFHYQDSLRWGARLEVDDRRGNSGDLPALGWLVSLPGERFLILTDREYRDHFAPERAEVMTWGEAAAARRKELSRG